MTIGCNKYLTFIFVWIIQTTMMTIDLAWKCLYGTQSNFIYLFIILYNMKPHSFITRNMHDDVMLQ